MKYNPEDDNVPYGQCHCGCGGQTNLAPKTNAAKGWVKGEPLRYIHGHNGRIDDPEGYFWSGVNIGEPDECWDWRNGAMDSGYGRATFKNERDLAHRIAWRIANDQEIPNGMVVMHLCDRPQCVNPAHLRLGTQAENVADRIEKGRSNWAKGESAGAAKLSEAEVVEIIHLLAAGATKNELAIRYGVSYACIEGIDLGRNWKHLR